MVPAPEVVNRPMDFPAVGNGPVQLFHAGDADQAAAVIAWPTGGGSQEMPRSRKLDLLGQIIAIRLLDGLRERAGAAYSPFVSSTWPLDSDSGGLIFAMAQVDPALVPVFFDMAEKNLVGENFADLFQGKQAAHLISNLTEAASARPHTRGSSHAKAFGQCPAGHAAP